MSKGNYEPGTHEAILNEVKNIIQMNPLMESDLEETCAEYHGRILRERGKDTILYHKVNRQIIQEQRIFRETEEIISQLKRIIEIAEEVKYSPNKLKKEIKNIFDKYQEVKNNGY